MEAVRKELKALFPTSHFVDCYTHDWPGLETYRLVRKARLAIVGGTNLLSSNMPYYNQWKIGPLETVAFRNKVTLMGVGWWQYQHSPNPYTRWLLNSILSNETWQSVRDQYTRALLQGAGIRNVLNTGCPTMWQLDEDHCSQIPYSKGSAVVCTLTDYNRHPVHDRDLIDYLLQAYDCVYFWPQGIGDQHYVNTLGLSQSLQMLSPSLDDFDELLASPAQSLDYVGTRLHAGIRALQKKRRSIIVGIDNRAVEKAADFDLNLCMRGDLDGLRDMVNDRLATRIALPLAEIAEWKRGMRFAFARGAINPGKGR